MDLCIQFKHLILRYFRLSEELQKQYREFPYALLSQEFVKDKNTSHSSPVSKVCRQWFSSLSAPACFQYCLAVKVGTDVITNSSPFFVCFCLFFPDYKRYFEMISIKQARNYCLLIQPLVTFFFPSSVFFYLLLKYG